MKTTKYLYGIEPESLDNMGYWEGLRYKITNGISLFRHLYKSGKDQDRCFWVNKAVDHTRELLKERDEQS